MSSQPAGQGQTLGKKCVSAGRSACTISKCVKTVKGLPKKSASPTDVWLITFTAGTTYDDGTPVTSGVLKIWLTSDNAQTNEDLAMISGLDYERDVYTEIVRLILSEKLCPNFVKCYAAGAECTIQQLVDILSSGLPDNVYAIRDQLARNLYYMYHQEEGRPEIHKPIDPNEQDYDDLANGRVNMILLESMAGNENLREWMVNHPDSVTNTLFSDQMWRILAQSATACYTMALRKLVHHDLHVENMYIQTKNIPDAIVQYVGNVKISYMRNDVMPKIFDYDRGYAETLGPNALLKGYFCDSYGQCNEVVENFDILKVLSGIYYEKKNYAAREKLVDFACRNDADKQYLRDVYLEGYLRDPALLTTDGKKRYRRSPMMDFKRFNTPLEILMNILNAAPKSAFKVEMVDASAPRDTTDPNTYSVPAPDAVIKRMTTPPAAPPPQPTLVPSSRRTFRGLKVRFEPTPPRPQAPPSPPTRARAKRPRRRL